MRVKFQKRYKKNNKILRTYKPDSSKVKLKAIHYKTIIKINFFKNH